MPKTIVIAGASGLVGTACVDAFLEAGWEVIAVSRRKPEISSDRPYTHLAVNLQSPQECESALSALGHVTHVVYAAVSEKPGLTAGWRDPSQMQINLIMLRNFIRGLSKVAHLEHVTLLQGTKAYGGHVHPMPVPARERHPRDDHPNFYWLHEDYIKEQSTLQGFAWTILRPTVILGPNYGVAMNIVPVVAVYATLCREADESFGFPGHVPYVQQAVDTRLVADAAVWAAVTPSAHYEHFNLSNGEVFTWQDLWPAIARTMSLTVGSVEPVSMAQLLPAKSELWRRIVARYGLRVLTMAQLLGESHHYADRGFGFDLEKEPSPKLVSTIKIKQAGFTATMDTEESVQHWLQVLMRRRIIPHP